MPTYEYYCQDCGDKFEIKATVQEKEKGLKVNCPDCGGKRTVQVFSNFNTLSRSNAPDFPSSCGPGCKPGCCG